MILSPLSGWGLQGSLGVVVFLSAQREYTVDFGKKCSTLFDNSWALSGVLCGSFPPSSWVLQGSQWGYFLYVQIDHVVEFDNKSSVFCYVLVCTVFFSVGLSPLSGWVLQDFYIFCCV